MTGGPPYALLFPLPEHFDRFRSIMEAAPNAPLLKAGIEALGLDPRPKSPESRFSEIPPAEEAQFLLSHFGIPFKEDLPSLYRAFARCRVRIGDYEVLYDVMDDLRIVWLFQIRKI